MNSELRLGDAALDQDHARLESLIIQLRDAHFTNAVSALDALHEDARQHFDLEDIELREIRDGNAECHVDEHAAVLKSLEQVSDVLKKNESSQDDQTALVHRLATQLLLWLPEHVRAMDAGVATYRAKKRFGGVPMAFARRPTS